MLAATLGVMCARLAAPLGLLRICLIVTALIPATIAQGYFERTYTEADGLPHQGIVDIEQTADGLLWFSTMAGLATYDGHSFTPVVVDEQARLWTRYQIATDDLGNLWTFDVVPPFEGRLRIDGSWQPLPANHLIDPATCPAHLTAACVAQRNGEHFALLGSSGGHLLLLSAAGAATHAGSLAGPGSASTDKEASTWSCHR